MKKPTVRRFLWYLFAVPRCAACRHLLGAAASLNGSLGSDVLCPKCRSAWEQEKLEICPICGEVQIDCRCMPEALAESGAETLVHLGEYRADAVIGRVILYLKDTPSRRTVDFAAAQLLPALRREAAVREIEPPEMLVTFLPRSRRARREHGHDQAELLARALAGRLGAECRPLLFRGRDGEAQKMLTARERAENVRGAFLPVRKYSCTGRTVVLVDDVVTTGSGMAEGVRILRESGAGDVICVSIGRSPEKKQENVKK